MVLPILRDSVTVMRGECKGCHKQFIKPEFVFNCHGCKQLFCYECAVKHERKGCDHGRTEK